MLKIAQSLDAQIRAHLGPGRVGSCSGRCGFDLQPGGSQSGAGDPDSSAGANCDALDGDGLSEDRDPAGSSWTDADLQRFQTIFSEIDLLRDMQRTLRGERATSLFALEKIPTNADGIRLVFGLDSEDEKIRRVVTSGRWWIRPSGYDFEDRALWVSVIQRMIDGLKRRRGGPRRRRTWKRRSPSERRTPREVFRTPFTLLLFSTFPMVLQRTFATAGEIDLAVVACGIERFR